MSFARTGAALLLGIAAWMALPPAARAQEDPARKAPAPEAGRDPPRDRTPRNRDTPNTRGDRPNVAPRYPTPHPPGVPGLGGPPPANPFFPGQSPFPMPTPGPTAQPGAMPGRPPFPARDPRYLEELKKFDPEMYELEVEDRDLERRTLELAQMFRLTSGEKRDDAKKQVAELVERHFDVRQSRRELHIKRLQEELTQLKKAIERRSELRDQIVGRRISELIGESDLDF